MRKLLLLLLALPALAADGSWHGFLRTDTGRGCLAIHNQAEYDRFVERIPKERVQMKEPAPPSEDPLLKKPAVDFQEHALVAVWTESIHIGCRIENTRRVGDDLEIRVDFTAPPDWRNYAGPYHYGQYHLLRVPAFAGQTRLKQ